MDTCLICGNQQDARQYPGYDICTACADVMEDIMGEYFVRTIWKSEPKAHIGYLNYLNSTTRYISDYKKLTQRSGQHTINVSGRVLNAVQNNSGHPSRMRYFVYMQKVLDWLVKTPYFYHYYFKEYYVCSTCGSSIFDKYVTSTIGEWLVVSCSNCDTVIKKYYAPKQA